MHTKDELKEMAKVVMFNPNSNKSQQLLMTLAAMYGTHPQAILNEINKLANA